MTLVRKLLFAVVGAVVGVVSAEIVEYLERRLAER